ncbi:MAG: hypothetical protein RL530_280 [Actinomycetota bacterium]
MIFKRTPAIEASLIYGVALILGFLIFAAFGGWQEAANLSKGMAFLIQFPTWVIMVVVGIFNKRATKYGRFFANISVISAVALIFIGIIYYLSSGAKGADVSSIQATFNWVAAVFFISSLIGSVLTQFVFFRKTIEPKPTTYAPAPNRPKKKKK